MLRYSSCHPTLSRYPRNALAGPRIWLGRDEACEDNKKSANLIYWFWALTFLLIAMPAGWRILLGLPMCGVRGGRRAPQLLQDEYESKIARAESDFSLRSALIQSSKLAKSNFSQSLGICRSSRCLWKFLSTPLWWKAIAPLPFRRPKTRQSLMYVRGFKPKSLVCNVKWSEIWQQFFKLKSDPLPCLVKDLPYRISPVNLGAYNSKWLFSRKVTTTHSSATSRKSSHLRSLVTHIPWLNCLGGSLMGL